MDYIRVVCDRTILFKSKIKHFQNLTHKDFDESIQIKHTIDSPSFFDIDERFDNFITNHNKSSVYFSLKLILN